MAVNQTCQIVCTSDLHRPIILPHSRPVLVGRTRECGLTDLRCSRKQVTLIADYETHEVTVKQEGQNPSEVDGTVLNKNESIIVRHGAIINIWQGDCVHKIEFSPSVINTKIKNPFEKPPGPSVKGDKENKKLRLQEQQSRWDEVNSSHLLIYTYGSETYQGKIAAFDLDGTLIKTKSGNVFAKDKTDWTIANDKVKSKLSELVEKGYKLVIFTNQSGIGRGKVNVKDFKEKVENIIKLLDVPVQVLIATSMDIFRKPAPGMWTHLVKQVVGSVEIEESFYVGDAAGRVVNWEHGKKKDFSMADRLFAKNLGLPFFTPEEYFLNKPRALHENPIFDPSKFVSTANTRIDINIPTSQNEVIVMVGAPGSGKSHFVKHNLMNKGYVPVSRDNLHTWQKCVSTMSDALYSNKNVVVDNTNPDIESRKRYLNKAKEHNVPVRCFVMDVTIEHCQHNNKFREFTDTSHEKISPIIINSFRKCFVPPQKEEGFEAVIKIPFIPTFTSSDQEKLYKMFLT